MFEDSLVESAGVLQQRNRWPVLISISLQAALAFALLSIPLLHPEVMSLRTPQLTLFTPPPKPPQPPPVPPRVRVVAAESAAALPNAAPAPVAAQIPHTGNALEPDIPNAPPATTGFNMGNSGPALPFSADPGGGPGRVVVRAAEARTRPLSVSSGVTSGLLLAPIEPVYPTIARVSHTEGTVVVQAIISRSGAIESAHVVSGPPMLQGAALDAVRRARYRPYLLNNQPTEVETTISIVFRMSS